MIYKDRKKRTTEASSATYHALADSVERHEELDRDEWGRGTTIVSEV
jgi:hypothetical protein